MMSCCMRTRAHPASFLELIKGLKAECFGTTIPATRAQAHSMFFDYIETFYNPVRLHRALGFRSPVAFENSIQNN